MKSLKEHYEIIESKPFKKGDDIIYVDQDGDDKSATIVSYNKKDDIYWIDVNGNEIQVEPEEIQSESVVTEEGAYAIGYNGKV